MNLFFKKIIQFILKWFAKIYIWRTKPYVIIIAGTTGRHWIKEAIKKVLEEKNFPVRMNRKNFNAEIGLPLSILGLSSDSGDFWQWLKILWQAFKKICQRSDVECQMYLVLEMAIGAPENIKYLTSIVKPDALILTTVTMIYAENFENLDEIGREYGELVKTLPWNGILILNNDDSRIRELGKYFSAEGGSASGGDGNVITFGFSGDSHYKAIGVHKVADGQRFKMEVQKKEIFDIKINRFGQHHIYAELVGAIIGDNIKEHQKDFFSKILK